MKQDYDLIVLGGGSAGLTAAGIAAQLGVRTLLVERHKLGGECLNTGCIPSKALVRSANVAALMSRASEYGLGFGGQVDFPAVMDRVAQVIRRIEPHNSAETLARYGVETQFGQAAFLSNHEVQLNGSTLRSSKFVIATGSRPFVPPLEGLTDYLTNETLFSIRNQPAHLVIVGAGPVGVEMAQAFRRLGSNVTLLERAPRILPREDEEISAHAAVSLKADGVRIYVDAKLLSDRVESSRVGIIHTITLDHHGTQESITGDALLVAAGRFPNFEELNLDKAGIIADRQGIRIDNRCRTTAPNIFACGDVTGHFQFTHMAEYQAKVAVSNAILHWPMKLDYRAVPWAIFTDPEIARVGLTELEARKQFGSVTIFRSSFLDEDRAIVDGSNSGMIKVIASKNGRKIRGAHIIGPRASEIIMEFVIAMQHGLSVADLSNTIHPYPSYSLAARHAADGYWLKKSSPTLVRWIQRIFGYSGPIAERFRGD